MRKTFTLLLLALISTSLSAQQITTLGNNKMCMAISPNHKYVAGQIYSGGMFIHDIEANETTEKTDDDIPECQIWSISNNGTAVGNSGNAAIKIDNKGNVSYIEPEAGTNEYSIAKGITDDDKTIVGCTFDMSYVTHACIWKDGVRTYLPEPTTESIGFEINGTQASGISGDGKVIVGYVLDNFQSYPVIYWTLGNDGNYTVHTPCKELFEPEWEGTHPYFVVAPSGISHNGKWIALTCQKNDGTFSDANVMARLDTETDKVEEIDAYEEKSCETTGIANDGTMIGYTVGSPMMGRVGLIVKAGNKKAEKIADVTGLEEVATFDTEVSTNSPIAISADGSHIAGFAIDTKSEDADFITFIIDMNAEPTGIANPEAATVGAQKTAVYSIDGKFAGTDAGTLGSGLYIIKTTTGNNVTTRKVLVK